MSEKKVAIIGGNPKYNGIHNVIAALGALAGPLPVREYNQADFTLPFPEPPAVPRALAEHLKFVDAMHSEAASLWTLQKSKARKLNRGLKHLSAFVGGGWVIEFEPRKHGPDYTSTRGQRRRILFGHEQAAVEVK